MAPEERIHSIETFLSNALAPTTLEVIDDSAQHHGHAGAASGAGHFTVRIASPLFEGKTPVACHRLIYNALNTLMHTDIHALSIHIIKNP